MKISIAGITGMNSVASQTEIPGFGGTVSPVLLLDAGLQLGSTALFESTSGNFDDATGFFDAGGQTTSVAGSGIYEFSQPINLAATFTARLTANITQSIVDRHTLFDAATGSYQRLKLNIFSAEFC